MYDFFFFSQKTDKILKTFANFNLQAEALSSWLRGADIEVMQNDQE